VANAKRGRRLGEAALFGDVSIIDLVNDVLRGALDNHSARSDSQLTENSTYRLQPALKIADLNVNVAAARAATAAGNLAKLCRLQRLVERVLNGVATAKREILALQYNLQKDRMAHNVNARTAAEQVIIQVWISSHFGVISKRLPAADESFGFIKAIFTPPAASVKP
jgi:hypothetical protein